jgi:hypothetical protein
MFARPVVFVVGAGASYEYKMPLGLQLAQSIANAVRFRFHHSTLRPISGDAALFDMLFRRFQTDRNRLNTLVQAGHAVAGAISSAISIDDALFALSENQAAVELGKLAIIYSIVRAERDSTIAKAQNSVRLDDAAGKNGWVEQLFSMATSGLRLGQFERAFDNVTFVNFNYDRCIEQYLFWSLQRVGIPESEADAIVSRLNMIRPYGSIGPLTRSLKGWIDFGSNDRTDLYELIDRIRTYTESGILHKPDELRSAMLSASLVIFLGFGFHQQNLDLLQLNEPSDGRFIMATVKGINSANLADITDALSGTLRSPHANIGLFDMTTPELLRELRPKIMMRIGR